MTQPLIELDHLAMKYRGVARKVAGKIAHRFRGVDFEDIEAACWLGVVYGLKTYDPERGGLLNHLFNSAKSKGWYFARRQSRRGISRIPCGVFVDVVGLTDLDIEWLVAKDNESEKIEEGDWRRLLARLSPKDARAVEMRFLEHCEYEEIAKEIGWGSAKSARGMVSLALARLRSRAKEDYEVEARHK